MAAGEDQSQQVVVHDVVRRKVGPREFDHPQSVPLLARAGPLAPEDVDRLSSRGHREPGTRLWRHPGDRPRAECRQGCLLHGVLGYLYVADGPNQGREDACALARTVSATVSCSETTTAYLDAMTGRTSTAPPQAAGSSDEIATASSRSAASSR